MKDRVYEGRFQETLGLPPCPQCHLPTLQRVAGVWCPRCRGWYMDYIAPGGNRAPYIGWVHVY